MRHLSEMDPRVTAIIGAACCGPSDGVWDASRRYWVCDYHDGYNDGLEACKEVRSDAVSDPGADDDRSVPLDMEVR
jgi:hypothetical protein